MSELCSRTVRNCTLRETVYGQLGDKAIINQLLTTVDIGQLLLILFVCYCLCHCFSLNNKS